MTTEYKERYQVPFIRDLGLSKEYRLDGHTILLRELGQIYDYEADLGEQPCLKDMQGYDLEIDLRFGFGQRVRDITKARYKDFTIDEKEWANELKSPHYYYFYAYAYDPDRDHKHLIDFWMIFDLKRLKRLHSEGKIKNHMGKNNKHSSVPFMAFDIKDILKHDLIITYYGTDALLELFGLPAIKNKRLDRYWEAIP